MNSNNLYVRHEYQIHLREAVGADPKTVYASIAAIAEFDAFIEHQDYLKLSREKSVAFKDYLFNRLSKSDGQPLSKSTIVHRLSHVRAFLDWVTTRKGYGALDPDVISFLQPPRRTELASRELSKITGPSPETVRTVILNMPNATFTERRNRALIALIYLTGVRNAALVSLRLNHIDLVSGCIYQNGTEVSTKFGKNMRTFFFPVGDDLLEIVESWVAELVGKNWSGDAPLFPGSTGAIIPAPGWESGGIFWQSTAPVRRILREACDAAGMEAFTPHQIRKTLMELGRSKCRTMKECKAWSQNLGHDDLITSEASYGTMKLSDVEETIGSIRTRAPADNLAERLSRLPPGMLKVVNTLVEVEENRAH